MPTIDPMTLDDGKTNLRKTNLYRSGVDQPLLSGWQQEDQAVQYCREALSLGARRIQQDRRFFLPAPSPDTGAANNLYTFLAQRWSGSLGNLNCANLISVPKTPVTLTTNADGVVTDAKFPRGSGGGRDYDH